MNFTDRQTQYPNRVKLKKITDEADGTIYDVERAEGNITQQGTPLNAENLNAINENIINSIPQMFSKSRVVRLASNISSYTLLNKDLYDFIIICTALTSAGTNWLGSTVIDPRILGDSRVIRTVVQNNEAAQINITRTGNDLTFVCAAYGGANSAYMYSILGICV